MIKKSKKKESTQKLNSFGYDTTKFIKVKSVVKRDIESGRLVTNINKKKK